MDEQLRQQFLCNLLLANLYAGYSADVQQRVLASPVVQSYGDELGDIKIITQAEFDKSAKAGFIGRAVSETYYHDAASPGGSQWLTDVIVDALKELRDKLARRNAAYGPLRIVPLQYCIKSEFFLTYAFLYTHYLTEKLCPEDDIDMLADINPFKWASGGMKSARVTR